MDSLEVFIQLLEQVLKQYEVELLQIHIAVDLLDQLLRSGSIELSPTLIKLDETIPLVEVFLEECLNIFVVSEL